MNVKVLVHEAEEGGFWGEVPASPGCASQGETLEELIANLREAVAGWRRTLRCRRRVRESGSSNWRCEAEFAEVRASLMRRKWINLARPTRSP